jgi:hypothetical protein
MKDIVSPDSYIDMGFYYMISAALQRRVWEGSVERPLFPNLYVLLVGPPACGKTQLIKPVTEILTFHKMRDRHKQYGSLSPLTDLLSSDSETDIKDTLDKADNKLSSSAQGSFLQQKRHKEIPLIFPVSADSITYEALIMDHASSVRFHPVPETLDGDIYGKFIKGKRYKHCSLNFLLEEVSTLFRKRTLDVCKYLLKAFDCGEYVHKTKTGGIDLVTNMCLNILGGTTPDFLLKSLDDDLINDGFTSRCIIVYEHQKRFEKFDSSKLTSEQLEAKTELIKHIFNLHKVFGNVTYTPDAYEYFSKYVEEVLPNARRNPSSKMAYYYGRKPLHLKKIAMAIHFSKTSSSMVIERESCEDAVALLNKLEEKMHLGLGVGGRTPISQCAAAIKGVIKIRKVASELQIMADLLDNHDPDLVAKSIVYLKSINEIVEDSSGKYKINEN